MARLAGPRLLTIYPNKPPCGYPMLLWHQAAPNLRKHPFLSLDCDDDCDLASILTITFYYYYYLTRALASSTGAARPAKCADGQHQGVEFPRWCLHCSNPQCYGCRLHRSIQHGFNSFGYPSWTLRRTFADACITFQQVSAITLCSEISFIVLSVLHSECTYRWGRSRRCSRVLQKGGFILFAPKSLVLDQNVPAENIGYFKPNICAGA